MMPENMFIPMMAKMKNMSSMRDPTLAIDGKITSKESTRTLNLREVLISLKTLRILIAFMMVIIVITPEDPSETTSFIKIEMSAMTTMKKSKRFQFWVK